MFIIKKILIVDDELKMRFLLKDCLKREGYEVLDATNGEEAIDKFLENKDVSLIVLDVMMPKLNGYEVCKKIREYSDVPILMLTAKSENEDIIKGFQLGSDDYLTKPFHLQIFIERVKALLRRTISEDEIVLDKLKIKNLSREVYYDNKLIELSNKEFELLSYFIKNKNIVLNREDLFKKIWNYDYIGDCRTLDTHIKTLRNKLPEVEPYIKTIRGIGYKFEYNEN